MAEYPDFILKAPKEQPKRLTDLVEVPEMKTSEINEPQIVLLDRNMNNDNNDRSTNVHGSAEVVRGENNNIFTKNETKAARNDIREKLKGNVDTEVRHIMPLGDTKLVRSPVSPNLVNYRLWRTDIPATPDDRAVPSDGNLPGSFKVKNKSPCAQNVGIGDHSPVGSLRTGPLQEI